MKKWLKNLFSYETEFTKKWIARFTIVVFILLLFYIILSQELLFFHFKLGLSTKMCKIFFCAYTEVMKVLITGYAVTFIASMAKAFLAKQQEEKNKLAKKLAECEDEEDYEYDEDEENVDIEDYEYEEDEEE
jgi:predicted membrane protein